MLKTITALILLVSIFSSPAFSEELTADNVVVTPARLPESEAEATSPVTVMRREEIERTGLVFLDDLLRRMGVVEVVRAGAEGAGARLFVRGAGPEQSVILIDGVRVASAFDGSLDISGITLQDVERIEISRGAHSVSYGSQAIGGVVNIITRRGGGPLSIELSYMGGGHGAENPSASISGGNKYRYRLSISDVSSEGISSIARGMEPDGFEERSYSGSLAMPLGKGGVLEVSGRREHMDVSLDREPALIPFGLADDPDLTAERRRELLMTRYTYAPSGAVIHTITVSEWEEDIIRRDPTYTIMNVPATAQYRGDARTSCRAYEYQASVFEEDGGVGVFGLEHRVETAALLINSGSPGGFSNEVAVNAAYLNLRMKDESHVLVFGARRTEHEISGDHVTYRFSALQHDEGTTLTYRAAYSTFLRLPTALELELGGSAALRPETGKGWEAGFDKLFGKDRKISVMYFDHDISDLIIRDAVTGIPANSGQSETSGVECSIAGGGSGGSDWSLSYTWLDADDVLTGEPLPLRPKDRIDLRVGHTGRKLSFQMDYSYVGRRPGLEDGVELEAYRLLNIGGSYRLGETFTLIARADNALDEEYMDMAGYNAAGREYYAGLRARF